MSAIQFYLMSPAQVLDKFMVKLDIMAHQSTAIQLLCYFVHYFIIIGGINPLYLIVSIYL